MGPSFRKTPISLSAQHRIPTPSTIPTTPIQPTAADGSLPHDPVSTHNAHGSRASSVVGLGVGSSARQFGLAQQSRRLIRPVAGSQVNRAAATARPEINDDDDAVTEPPALKRQERHLDGLSPPALKRQDDHALELTGSEHELNLIENDEKEHELEFMTRGQAQQQDSPVNLDSQFSAAKSADQQGLVQQRDTLSPLGTQQVDEPLSTEDRSVDAMTAQAIKLSLLDAKQNPPRSIPQNGFADNQNSVSTEVPGFPDLSRGSARADGNCLFYSAIHLGHDVMRQHMSGDITAQKVRDHIALNMMSDFNIGNLTSDHKLLSKRLSETAQTDQVSELNDAKLERFFQANVGAKEQFESLSDTQKMHVMNMAASSSYDHRTGDYFPALLAEAFPGLKVVVHSAEVTSPEMVKEHYTHQNLSDPTNGGSKTVRLFLENAHYEPVFEKK